MKRNAIWWSVAGLFMMSAAVTAAEAPGSLAFPDAAANPELVCAGIVVASAGPADGCCERHASFCDALCTGRSYEFNCWANGTGGCQSTCKCSGGPPPV